MKHRWKVLLVLIGVVLLGVSGVFAQDQPQEPTPILPQIVAFAQSAAQAAAQAAANAQASAQAAAELLAEVQGTDNECSLCSDSCDAIDSAVAAAQASAQAAANAQATAQAAISQISQAAANGLSLSRPWRRSTSPGHRPVNSMTI